MSISEAIETIVRDIKAGHLFDTHFIIQQLQKNYSDEYIRFTCQYSNGGEPTLKSHQMIGHEIKKFNGQLVERLDFDSWSENIHGENSPCAAWKKL